MEPNQQSFSKRVVGEVRLFGLYTLFFTLLFWSLTLYQRLLLGQISIAFIHYSYGFIQAVIIAKVLVLGEHFEIGRRWDDQSLIIPTLYKSLLFSLLIFLFFILEQFVMGYFYGKSGWDVYERLADDGLDMILAKVMIVFLTLLLFFAFTETGRVIGEKKLYKLFFRRLHPD